MCSGKKWRASWIFDLILVENSYPPSWEFLRGRELHNERRYSHECSISDLMVFHADSLSRRSVGVLYSLVRYTNTIVENEVSGNCSNAET